MHIQQICCIFAIQIAVNQTHNRGFTLKTITKMITVDFQNSHLQYQEFSNISEEINLMDIYLDKSEFVSKVEELEKAVQKDLPTWKDEYGIEQNEVTRIISYYCYGFNGVGKKLVTNLKSFLYEYDIVATKKKDSNNQKVFSILSQLEKMITQ